MKKAIAILLALVMVLSLAACGGGSTKTETPEPTAEATPLLWTVEQTRDDFGDITDNSVSVLQTPISGEFSNTATSGSKLGGFIHFMKKPQSEHYVAAFTLLEYEDTKAAYISSDSLTLRVKLDDTIYDFPLKGEAPNGILFLGTDKYDYGGDWLFDELYMGWDLRCIVNIGSSQYNFTVESGNFAELCDKEGFSFAPANETVKEAVIDFLNDANVSNAKQTLFENAGNLRIVGEDELKTLLNGNNFLQITCDRQYWTIHRYADGIKKQILYFSQEAYGREFNDPSNSVPSKGKEIVIEDGLLIQGQYGKAKPGQLLGDWEERKFQLREVCENVYILYLLDDSGNIEAPEDIMILYNTEIQSTEDLYTAREDIISDYLR